MSLARVQPTCSLLPVNVKLISSTHVCPLHLFVCCRKNGRKALFKSHSNVKYGLGFFLLMKSNVYLLSLTAYTMSVSSLLVY